MLYGPGWFNVTRGWLRLTNPTNSFSGTIAINQSSATKWAAVGFHNATAWPEDNWNVLTNENGAIQLSVADVRLPDLDVTADGGTFTNTMIFGTGSGIARSLVKRGPGLLALDANTVAGGGTLKVYDRLLLGADAAVSVQASGFLQSSPEGGWTAVEADGGITLPENWQGRVTVPNSKYRLSLSEDGKRLILEHNNGSILSIR